MYFNVSDMVCALNNVSVSGHIVKKYLAIIRDKRTSHTISLYDAYLKDILVDCNLDIAPDICIDFRSDMKRVSIVIHYHKTVSSLSKLCKKKNMHKSKRQMVNNNIDTSRDVPSRVRVLGRVLRHYSAESKY